MNILIVLPNDTLGGAEQYLKMITQNYKGSNVRVLFLQETGSGLWDEVSENVTKVFFSKRSKGIGLIKMFFDCLFNKTKKYDYIFTSHVFITAILGMFITARLVKKEKFIARESTSIFKRFKGKKLLLYKIAYFLGYHKVDLLICQTDYMKNQFQEGLPKLSKQLQLTVIPNPIDIELINKKEKELPDFEPPLNYIVSAGRLIPEKGFDLLIQAFAKLLPDHPNLQLLILGEGPERNALENLIEALNLKKSVLMPGLVFNVYPFFKLAQVCIVSSRLEGFPNVLLQMMSQNEKVISTLCAGGIEDMPSIIKIQPNNIDELYGAMQNQLSIKTMANKAIFDAYLKERSIEIFVEKINTALQR